MKFLHVCSFKISKIHGNNQEMKRSMDEEERKQAAATRRSVPYMELDQQVHSDFAFAMALQEQERALNTLMSIESDTEEEEEDEEGSDGEEDSSQENNGNNDYEYFESQELEFLEGQDSNSEEEEDDDDMEEDEIDPDELSYEELIALGEFIGEEKRGLSADEIQNSLKPFKCNCMDQKNNKCGIDRCVICQVEYNGEDDDQSLVALSCEHPYHSECITSWLQIKKICPICSFEVSSSSPKILNS